MRVQFVLQEIWIGLRRNLTMTISLVITVAIAGLLVSLGMEGYAREAATLSSAAARS